MEKKLIFSVLLVCILSCSVKKTLPQQEVVSNEIRVLDTLQIEKILQKFKHLTEDSVLLCENYPSSVFFSIKENKVKAKYGDLDAYSCFCKKAFFGNQNAEEIITLASFALDAVPCSEIRSLHLFPIVLSNANDFRVINAPGSPNHDKTSYDSEIRLRLTDMIKSIDGYDLSTYLIIHHKSILGHDDKIIGEIFINNYNQWMKYEYEAIVYAYKNDLITCKDYGEE